VKFSVLECLRKAFDERIIFIADGVEAGHGLVTLPIADSVYVNAHTSDTLYGAIVGVSILPAD
jgi:hypothetical protein